MVQACYCSMPVLAANNAFAARELFGLPSATEIRSLTSSSLSISTPCLMPSPLSMYTTSSVATLPAHQMHVFLLQGVTKHMHEHQSVHMGQLGNADLHSKKQQSTRQQQSANLNACVVLRPHMHTLPRGYHSRNLDMSSRSSSSSAHLLLP